MKFLEVTDSDGLLTILSLDHIRYVTYHPPGGRSTLKDRAAWLKVYYGGEYTVLIKGKDAEQAYKLLRQFIVENAS